MSTVINSIKAVSFDLDDTLWDCSSVIQLAEQVCHDWLAKHADRAAGSAYRSTMMQHRQQILTEQPELAGDVTQLRKNMLIRTLEQHGYTSDVAHAAFEVFYQARSQVQLYSGCNELLEGLRGKYKVAAITNGNADLAIAGIDHFFDAIHKADLKKRAKPHRHMFDLCLSDFELEPSAMLHVGDNPETDVAGAQALGIKTVWFNSQQISWPESQPRADFEVKSLSELQQLLLAK